MATYHLDETVPHSCWDNSLEPRLVIESGDRVVFDTLEAMGQVTPEWTSREFDACFDISKVHALTGPVAIKDAEPGDTLAVEVMDFQHKGWGYSLVCSQVGLLASEVTETYLHHYRLHGERCEFNESIHIPFEPFCGCMGVAPAEKGRLDTIPPRLNGGNIDIRHLTKGTVVYLPVLHPGALFSCGDCHAAQGDGEINGTGIEAPMTVTLQFELLKGRSVPEVQFRTPAGQPLTHAADSGYYVTTAHGPDLHENAKTATRYMLDHLMQQYGLKRHEAYALCGAAIDLKISEIVDVPNFIVSAYLPMKIFQ